MDVIVLNFGLYKVLLFLSLFFFFVKSNNNESNELNKCKIVREVLTNCCIRGWRNLDWLYLDFVSEAEELNGREKAAPGKQIDVTVPRDSGGLTL